MIISRSDRRALTLIFAVIAAAVAGVVIDRLFLSPNEKLMTLDEAAMDSLSSRVVVDSVDEGSLGHGSYYATTTREAEVFAFDPNTADSAALLRLGLAPWQVRAIYKYRAKGGRYHRREDFQRVPGMTPEVYERLAPHIHIGEAFRYYSDGMKNDGMKNEGMKNEGMRNERMRTDSVSAIPHQEKFRELVQLDLNTVDTATLKMVPGIASYRARRIVEYRERLGGYVSVGQLMETGAIPEELAVWFTVNTPVMRKIAINRDDVGTLARHPYLTYAQARAIAQYRHNYGTIGSLTDLSLSDVFTAKDLERLAPYVEY